MRWWMRCGGRGVKNNNPCERTKDGVWRGEEEEWKGERGEEEGRREGESNERR